jgi:site-specific DNA recombinase
MIAHNLLEGKMAEGRHEPLVSKDIFLRANRMLHKNHQKYKHDKEQESLPLKRFVKCEECGSSFTGYIVKKKGIYYYKCSKIGCKCNKNANEMHQRFKDFMSKHSLNFDCFELYQDGLYDIFHELNKENAENQKLIEKQLKEINEKLELIEERYVLKEISKEMYDKFNGKFWEEKREILAQLQQMDFNLSNLESYITFSIDLSSKLQEMWNLSDVRTKEKIQNLLFPEGIYYERKISSYRTERTNIVFELIRSMTEEINKTKKGQISNSADLSLSVPRRRLYKRLQLG